MAVAPLTAEQERALAEAAGRPLTAVAAGAGAGKTTLMVEAIWRDLERDGVPLERVMAMAYNRAAAAHLTARLQARFADADDGRGTGRPGLDLSAAWVGTFHSIAARLVREHPFEAGVDPEFGELDETEARSLMEQALDEALEACIAHPGLLELVASARNTDSLREATLHVHERLRAAGHERPRLAVPHAPGPSGADLAELRSAAAELGAHPRARDAHRAAAELGAALADAEAAPAQPPRGSLNCARDLRPVCERFNAAAEAVHRALVDREAREQLDGFARHLEEFSERYAALKRERGALDYEDLLLAARRVLRAGRSPRPARVYVDEFQDANALQAEIVDLLGAERTVMVGDGCQAIYGFRHADASHFAERAGSPPHVALRDNHRSTPRLMRALNAVLERMLAAEPAFAPLVPTRADDPAAPVPALEVVDVVSADGAPASREQEAEATAGLVARLLDDGFRPREVVVLFRALTQVEPYRAAIEARGIPVHLVAGRGFFTHDQVADTIALLRLVENPHDEQALVRVLASPYVAASDADLVALRAAAGEPVRGGWPERGALWPATTAVPGTRPVRAIVEGLRPLLRERGLPGLVEAATWANGYELAVLGLPDGARRHANLRRLVRLAADHAAVRGPDLRGFLRLLDRMAADGAQDPGEAVLVDPGHDAVRLLTVHGAKGREFPAVVLADASHGGVSSRPAVLVDRDGRCGIRVSRVGATGTSAALGHDVLAGAEKRAELAEERRIAYVALTRAERYCAVVGRSTAKGDVAAAAFTVIGAAAGALTPGEGIGLRRVAAEPPPGDDTRPRLAPRPALAAEPPAPRADRTADAVAGARLSFSALQAFATCPRRFHLERERGLRGRPDAAVAAPGAAPAPPGGWGGTAFGDLVHRALAAHDWHGPAPAPGWAAAAAAASGLPASPADAERAERQVAALLEGELAARVRAGRARSAERPFAVVVDGVLLTGAIDLMVDEGDGRALLLDWKTHALGPGRGAGAVAAEYELQRALYALAALEAGHREVALAWVVLDDLAATRVDAMGAGEAGALRARVAGLLGRLRDPARPAAASVPQPFCSGCPGLDAMCPVAGSAR